MYSLIGLHELEISSLIVIDDFGVSRYILMKSVRSGPVVGGNESSLSQYVPCTVAEVG